MSWSMKTDGSAGFHTNECALYVCVNLNTWFSYKYASADVHPIYGGITGTKKDINWVQNEIEKVFSIFGTKWTDKLSIWYLKAKTKTKQRSYFFKFSATMDMNRNPLTHMHRVRNNCVKYAPCFKFVESLCMFISKG